MLWSPKLNIIAAITVKKTGWLFGGTTKAIRFSICMNTYPMCHSMGTAITVRVCEQKPYYPL